ncbi:MAG: cytochrome C biogenesis protein [Muricauda sp.]|nr:protein-disulfide reductase DsbD domain-containing protein [uncultured Allomuricauda sp.]MBC72870.1 cytochrome C biogenesis protein [Allomuricauda sp.]|tara:strand:- start:159 stop:605 length:447 start_codon:yes stop_codon:yes gene_type:complete
MKKLVWIVLLLGFFSGKAQIFDPVKWTTTVKQVSDTEFDLIATATIEDNWHLYSQSVPDNGPLPTTFIFKGNEHYLKKGNTREESGHTVEDPIFNMEIKYFETKATFVQRIRVKGKKGFRIEAVVEFMVCDNTKCLPPKEVDLVFEVQ